jgi:hypothetical protein
MKKILTLIFLLAATLACLAQEEEGKKQDTSAKPATAVSDAEPAATYKLDFKIFEVEDGKRINQRDFVLMTSAGRHDPPITLRIGTRVPVGTGDKQNYLDVGFNVWATLLEQAGKLTGTIRMEMSSFALPEQNNESRSSGMPVLRNSNFSVSTVLVLGKPQLIISIDDPNSKKTTQVQVLATKLD